MLITDANSSGEDINTQKKQGSTTTKPSVQRSSILPVGWKQEVYVYMFDLYNRLNGS